MTNPLQVVAYRGCLPKSNKKQEKVNALFNFCLGALANGDNAYMHEGKNIVDCDVAVILGWVHENSKDSSHLRLRKKIVDRQMELGRHVVIIDSNMFLYKNTDNSMNYLRYSFDGVFPTTGIYCDTTPIPGKWDQIKNDIGLELEPYRADGNHILLCLQRNGGWSMGTTNISDWAAETIVNLRQYTNRPIVLRPHPGDRLARSVIGDISHMTDVVLSSPDATLMDDLQNCWAVVNHNSSPAVGAAIQGYPIFLTDPDHSQCKEIANVDFANIENPILHNREDWVQRISTFHWNFDDIRSGQCWAHMRQYLLDTPQISEPIHDELVA
jgi:hypothetical protein